MQKCENKKGTSLKCLSIFNSFEFKQFAEREKIIPFFLPSTEVESVLKTASIDFCISCKNRKCPTKKCKDNCKECKK